MLVKDVYALLDALAPFETAEEYDNVGLLIGDANAPVTGIMVALDATAAVLTQMKTCGANVLVTHHPLMYAPIRRICEADHEGALMREMIRSCMHLLCAHTNFDRAAGGPSDTLSALLALQNVAAQGYTRTGDLKAPQTALAFKETLSRALGSPALLMGDESRHVSKVCICAGDGSSDWQQALLNHADAYVTGEMKHHHVLEATARGLVVFLAGHLATENPAMDALWASLQKAPVIVQCNVAVYRAKKPSYSVR